MSRFEKLFVYGTLQDPLVQKSLIGRTVTGEADTLSGYIINMALMPPYPVALAKENSTIDGHVLSVTNEELNLLDDYEGDCYLRVDVTLQSKQNAWVYIGNPACYPDSIDLLD